MTDLIVIAIVVVIVGSALGYIIRAKKRGVKCIGCPAGGNCTSCPSSGETAGLWSNAYLRLLCGTKMRNTERRIPVCCLFPIHTNARGAEQYAPRLLSYKMRSSETNRSAGSRLSSLFWEQCSRPFQWLGK